MYIYLFRVHPTETYTYLGLTRRRLYICRCLYRDRDMDVYRDTSTDCFLPSSFKVARGVKECPSLRLTNGVYICICIGVCLYTDRDIDR